MDDKLSKPAIRISIPSQSPGKPAACMAQPSPNSPSPSRILSPDARVELRNSSRSPTHDPMARVEPIGRLQTAARESIPLTKSPRRQRGTRSVTPTPIVMEHLPRFSETPECQWPSLFVRKLSQCEAVFDFTDMLKDSGAREMKSQTLDELVNVLSQKPAVVDEDGYQSICSMFAKNIFRPIPPPSNPVGDEYDPEEDEPVLEPSWPHLQLVHELFVRFLELPNFNGNVARRYIDQPFVMDILRLFDVEDPRERDYLKTILHRIYGKFLQLRAFIRKSMHNVFYDFIYENERHNIAEMLEIFGSIINGFALPLKEEHKIFLVRTLIPLHKCRSMALYYPQLAYCVVQFVEKEAALASAIVKGLCRLWPKVNSTKEVMFLNEIEEILDLTPPAVFADFHVPFCQQLARCICSSHFQVAERALCFWNNEYVVTLMAAHAATVMPIIFPALFRHSRLHWNRNVQGLVFNALKIFMDMDPMLFERCSTEHAIIRQQQRERQGEREELWKRLEGIAISGESSCRAASPMDMQVDSKPAGELQEGKVKTLTKAEAADRTAGFEGPSSIAASGGIQSSSSSTSVRRKSVLPVDERVYTELSRYRSLQPVFGEAVPDDEQPSTEPDQDSAPTTARSIATSAPSPPSSGPTE